MKKTASVLLILVIGIAVLAIDVIWLHGWLNRPLPISLNDPEARSIRAILIRSQEIEDILYCDPKSDVNMLDSVFIDTSDYKPNTDNKLLIAKYLGDDAVKKAGYLTFIKAYHLWDRSGDPYPRSALNVTPNNSTKIAPTERPMRYCPNPLPQPEVLFRSIAIRENRAVVKYDTPAYLRESILIRIEGVWLIASMRNLQIHV